MTEAKVLALAKKRFGKNVRTEFRPKALTEPQKAERWRQIKELRIARDAIDTELRGITGWEKDLLEAAEFVLDVGGQQSALDVLREKAAVACRVFTLLAELRDIKKQLAERDRGLHSRRCSVLTNSNLIPGFPLSTVEMSADTWDELAEKLQAKVSV